MFFEKGGSESNEASLAAIKGICDLLKPKKFKQPSEVNFDNRQAQVGKIRDQARIFLSAAQGHVDNNWLEEPNSRIASAVNTRKKGY